MTVINVNEHDPQELNRLIKQGGDEVTVAGCLGQRFIGCGISGKKITVSGIPGNALGAYLDGAEIYCEQDAQDAVGDTMNEGKIIINGSAGDALGYAMRGGCIFVKGDSGYRTGIHMKEYKEKRPVIVVGGGTGSFLGEYLAGGLIIVLGISYDSVPVGYFTGTGMHGGKIIIRSVSEPQNLPQQVCVSAATDDDLSEIVPYIEEYCGYFGAEYGKIASGTFYKLTPNAKSPYKKLYTPN